MTAKKTETVPQGREVADLVSDKKADAGVQGDAAEDLAKDALKQQARASTGTEGEVDPKASRFLGSDETNLIAYMLDMGLDALEKAIDPKGDHTLPENKIAGLLILERNGQNRTDYVRLLMKRLGIKDLSVELPQAGGPGYTNDTTNLSDL